ncbi:integrase/recombinase%2C phage integrase family protein [Streptococcus pneumoniae]|nr:integrase/recombinase%2C phage integrase family protein [Streptococcus pneumoniae]
MESKVTIIMQEMLPLLNNEQLLALRESLEHHLVGLLLPNLSNFHSYHA